MSSHKPLTGKHIAQAVAMGLAGGLRVRVGVCSLVGGGVRMARPDLHVIANDVPSAAEIAALTWDSTDWQSEDGLSLIPFLVDRLGPAEAQRLLDRADDYLTRAAAPRRA